MKRLGRVVQNKALINFQPKTKNFNPKLTINYCLKPSTNFLRFCSFSFLPDYRLHERGLLRLGRVKKCRNFKIVDDKAGSIV